MAKKKITKIDPKSYSGLVIAIIIVAVMVFAVFGYVVYVILDPDWGGTGPWPEEYYCGHGEFGGIIGAPDPQYCDDEWEIVEMYKPICEELVQKYEPSGEQTCKVFLDSSIYKPCQYIFLSYSDESYCEAQFEILELEASGLDEEEQLEIYRSLCEELSKLSHGPEWNAACQMVLQNPDGVCIENMQDLGITLTDEEELDCLERIRVVTEQMLGEYGVY